MGDDPGRAKDVSFVGGEKRVNFAGEELTRFGNSMRKKRALEYKSQLWLLWVSVFLFTSLCVGAAFIAMWPWSFTVIICITVATRSPDHGNGWFGPCINTELKMGLSRHSPYCLLVRWETTDRQGNNEAILVTLKDSGLHSRLVGTTVIQRRQGDNCFTGLGNREACIGKARKKKDGDSVFVMPKLSWRCKGKSERLCGRSHVSLPYCFSSAIEMAAVIQPSDWGHVYAASLTLSRSDAPEHLLPTHSYFSMP